MNIYIITAFDQWGIKYTEGARGLRKAKILLVIVRESFKGYKIKMEKSYY